MYSLLFGENWPIFAAFQSPLKISKIDFWSKFVKIPSVKPCNSKSKAIALLFGENWPIFAAFQSPLKISKIDFWSKVVKIPSV